MSSPSPASTGTSAVARRRTDDHVRLRPSSGSRTVSPPSSRDAGADVARGVAGFRRIADASTPCSRRGKRLRQPEERVHRRPDEQLEGHEDRDGVARKAEDEVLAPHAERDRLPRLHRDAPEDLLDAQVALGLAHEVVRADRGAARRDDEVEGEEGPLERPPELVAVVRHDARAAPARRRPSRARPRAGARSTRRSRPGLAPRPAGEARSR